MRGMETDPPPLPSTRNRERRNRERREKREEEEEEEEQQRGGAQREDEWGWGIHTGLREEVRKGGPCLPGPSLAMPHPLHEEEPRGEELGGESDQKEDENRRLQPVGHAKSRVRDLRLVAPVGNGVHREILITRSHG